MNAFTVKEQVAKVSWMALIESLLRRRFEVIIEDFSELQTALHRNKANQNLFDVTKCSSSKSKQNEFPHICLMFDANLI